MNLCICIHIYIHIYMCLHAYTYLYVYIQILIICIYIYACIDSLIFRTHFPKRHTCVVIRYLYTNIFVYTYMYIFTGWRSCIGCLKLQISPRKRATTYMALLRKITYKDTVSFGSWLPCSKP